MKCPQCKGSGTYPGPQIICDTCSGEGTVQTPTKLRRKNERVLRGDAAVAWLDAKLEGDVRHDVVCRFRVDAYAAVRGNLAWDLVVAPSIGGFVRNPAGGKPLPVKVELAFAVQCRKCGHRLQPNQVTRRIAHQRDHLPPIPHGRITPDML